MLWNLIKAEWKKVTGDRWLVGCTIWVWPFSIFFFSVVLFIYMLLNAESRTDLESLRWTGVALGVWFLPNFIVVRPFLLGFAATLFATEYHHNTLKTVLPGNQRYQLILAKFITISAFITGTFVIAMLIGIAGVGTSSIAYGGNFFSASVDFEFVRDLVTIIVLTFLNLLILCGFAALVTIWTRSLMFGIVISVSLIIFESFGLLIFIGLLEEFGQAGAFADTYLLTPSYNINNLREIIINDRLAPHFVEERDPISGTASIIISAVYFCVTFFGSLFAFQRQNIT